MKKEITDTHRSEKPRKILEPKKEGVKAARQEFEMSDAISANTQTDNAMQNVEFPVKILCFLIIQFCESGGTALPEPPGKMEQEKLINEMQQDAQRKSEDATKSSNALEGRREVQV